MHALATFFSTLALTAASLFSGPTLGAFAPLSIPAGGTGTSTKPTYGQILVGNALGSYTLTATSSLGITGGTGTSFGKAWEIIAGILSPTTTIAVSLPSTLSVTGTTTLATTTTSMLNGVIVVDGVKYPTSGAGVKAAVNAAIAKGGGTVYIPDGTYSFTSGTSLSFGGKPIRLIGAGATTTRFVANGVGGGIIYDYFGTATNPANRPDIEISGITFDVNYVPTLSAIQIASSNNLYIHDTIVVHVQNIWGVLLGSIGGTLGAETANDYEDSASKHLRFINNTVASSTFGTNEGVLCVNCRDFDISHNYFYNNTQGPAALALYVGSSRGVVSHNTFASSTIKSFYSSGVDHFSFDHNVTSQAAGTVTGGLQIFNTTHAIIDSNILIGTNDGGSAGGGIQIYDYNGSLDGHNTSTWATTTDIRIVNNEFDKAYYGISIAETSGTDKHYEKRDIYIENNSFKDILWEGVHIGTNGSTANDSTQKMQNIFIKNNRASGSNANFAEGFYSIVGSSTNPIALYNIHVVGNQAVRSTAGGDGACVFLSGVSSYDVSDNHCDGVAHGGYSDIQVQADAVKGLLSKQATSTGFYFGATTTLAGGTTTASNGVSLTAGCFSMNGVCLSAALGEAWRIVSGYLTPTTTLGILVNASSTIGAGGNATGLTISGGATTTGRAYFSGLIGQSTTSPDSGASFNNFTGRALVHIGDDSTNDSRTKLLIENRWTGGGAPSFVVQRNNSTPHFVVDGNAFIGMGTGTPGTLLSLGNTGVNTINIDTAATSTFGSGLNIRSGCFAVSNVCLTPPFGEAWQFFSSKAWLAPSTTVGVIVAASSTIGSGTQPGGLTVAGGATTTGNLIVQSTGTSTFAGQLTIGNTAFVDIVGGAAGATNPFVGIRTNSTAANSESTLVLTNTTASTFARGSGSGEIGVIRTNSPNAGNSDMVFRTADNTGATGLAERLRINYRGYLGIATTSPGTSLAVSGDAVIAGQITGRQFTATSTLSASLFPYASTTAITSTTASTTNFFGAGLSTCTGGNVLTWSGGLFGCAVDATGSGGGFGEALSFKAGPFLTPSSTIGLIISASSTFLGGLTIDRSTTTAATTTSLFATTASSTNLFVSTGSGLLKSVNGLVTAATAGTDYLTSVFAFPFTNTTFGATNANATSTLMGFTAGIYSLASSTIGDGTQAGGVTIAGGATTTKDLVVQGTGTSTFAGKLTIGNNAFVEVVGGSAGLTVPYVGIRSNSTANNTEATLVLTNTTASTFARSSGSGEIGVIRTNAPTAGNSDMVFRNTNNGAGGFMERMRLAYNGNLGLGSTSPFARISISLNGNNDTVPYSFLISSTTAANATSTHVAIMNNGNVGLSTSTPGTTLGVTGNGLFTGELTAPFFTATSTLNTSTLKNFTFVNGTGTAATTTSFFTTTASTTNFFGAGLSDCANSATSKLLYTAATGLFSCGTDQSSAGGGTYPFITATNFNVVNQATTGIAWFQNGVNASSTSHFFDIEAASTIGASGYYADTFDTWSAAQITVQSPLFLNSSNALVAFGSSTLQNFTALNATTSQATTTALFASSFFLGTTTAGTLKVTESGYVYSDPTPSSGGAPGGSDGQIQFNDSSAFAGAVGLVWNKLTGMLGVGSSTPWGVLSVASSTYNYISPLFAVSTSSAPTGFLFGIFGTSTTMLSRAGYDSGARVMIGTSTTWGSWPGGLDQLTVNGRINTGDWQYQECVPSGFTTLTVDSGNICGGRWQYMIDANGQGISGVNQVGQPYVQVGLITAQTANNGAGFFAGNNGGATNWLGIATNTPVMETQMAISGTATGTNYYFGFTNMLPNATTFEVEPTAGCFFKAATTTGANWQAVCKQTAALATVVDTGVASSTIVGANGPPVRLRIEAGSTTVSFYAMDGTLGVVKRTDITTNIPVVAMSPAFYLMNTMPGAVDKYFRYSYLRFWHRTPLVNSKY